MSAQPQWESTDDETHDLLALVALGVLGSPTPEEEWQDWLDAATTLAATNDGLLDPNALRELTKDVVAPQRRGAFTNRALSLGLMEPAGWVVSTDREGRNSGRPARSYTWLGGAA